MRYVARVTIDIYPKQLEDLYPPPPLEEIVYRINWPESTPWPGHIQHRLMWDSETMDDSQAELMITYEAGIAARKLLTAVKEGFGAHGE